MESTNVIHHFIMIYRRKRNVLVATNTGENVMCKAVADMSIGLAIIVARGLYCGRSSSTSTTFFMWLWVFISLVINYW